MTPSGEVGSIGVFVQHLDHSGALEKAGVRNTFVFSGARKVDANPYEPLSKLARVDLKARVDAIHGAFLAAVGRGRGVAADYVRVMYGDGRMFDAKKAVSLGMADRVATLDVVLASSPSRQAKSRALAMRIQADRDLLDVTLAMVECPPSGPNDHVAESDLAELTRWLVEHPSR